jgi:ABC-type sulfate transport system permease component
MSDGEAIGAGLLTGLIIVLTVLLLAPFATDAAQTAAEREQSMWRTARAASVMFAALLVAFIAAIFTLPTLPTVLAGVNAALCGVGALALRKRLGAGGGT